MITPHHPEDEDFAVALLYHPDGLREPPMELYFPLAHLHRPEFRDMREFDTERGVIVVGGDGHVDGVDLLPPEERPLWRRISMTELALRFYFSQRPPQQPEAGSTYFSHEWVVLTTA
jgi:hypothetical protein